MYVLVIVFVIETRYLDFFIFVQVWVFLRNMKGLVLKFSKISWMSHITDIFQYSKPNYFNKQNFTMTIFTFFRQYMGRTGQFDIGLLSSYPIFCLPDKFGFIKTWFWFNKNPTKIQNISCILELIKTSKVPAFVYVINGKQSPTPITPSLPSN